jgi:hypothetical protein
MLHKTLATPFLSPFTGKKLVDFGRVFSIFSVNNRLYFYYHSHGSWDQLCVLCKALVFWFSYEIISSKSVKFRKITDFVDLGMNS